jgi:uncharacterized protein (TIGR02246 family)
MTTGHSLEARLRRLEDLESIRALTNAYHAGINANDLEGICAGFAEDAVLVLANGVPVKGREAIRASYVGAMGKIKRVKQFIHAHTIEIDGEKARATSDLDARYVAVNDPNSYLVSARLLYEYVKRDGRWWTSRYEVKLDFRVPLQVGWAGENLIWV